MPSRRAVLSALAAGALAGCTESEPASGGTEPAPNRTRAEGNGTTTETTTATPPTERTLRFGETVERSDGSLELHDPFTRDSAVTLQADTARVYGFGGPDRQALFVRVSASGSAAAESFSLVADSSYAPLRTKRPLYPLYYLPEAYTAERGAGWVAFEVPAPFDPEAAPRVELETDGGTLTWSLPDAAAAALRREPPSFSLRAFETPDAVPAGEPVTATVEVTNEGGAGTFRGAVNTGGYLHASYNFAFEVPAGKSRRKEVFAESFDGETTLYLSLVGTGIGGVSRREVTVGQ